MRQSLDFFRSDARVWAARAEEMRVAAEDMKDPENKATALRIAADYERLAKRAAEMARRHVLSPELDGSDSTPWRPSAG